MSSKPRVIAVQRELQFGRGKADLTVDGDGAVVSFGIVIAGHPGRYRLPADLVLVRDIASTFIQELDLDKESDSDKE